MPTHEPRHHDKPHHPHRPLQALLFGFVVLIGLWSVHAPETWVHVKTGALILAEKRVPRSDPFSASAAGAPWTTDSWLFDVAGAKLDALGGPAALTAAKSAAMALAFALLLPINHGSPLLAASLLALGACGGWAGWTETPAALDPLFFALLLRLLRPRARFRSSRGASAIALTALWANVHGGSAVLGVWLIGLKAFKASLRTPTRERIGYWAVLLGAVVALSCNPLGWSVVGRSFADAGTVPGGWPAPLLSLHSALGAAALLACWVTLQAEFVTTLACATAIALALALPGLRPLGAIAAAPVLALALGHWLPPRQDTWPRVARWAVFAAALLALYRRGIAEPFGASRGYGAPELAGAAHYARAAGLRGRLFNPPEAGAELIGLGPLPVFVDERPGVYADEFRRDAAGWRTRFMALDAVYRFDAAILPNRRAGWPARALDEAPGWALAYADDGGLVYVRKDGASADVLKAAPARTLAANRLWPDRLDAALADRRRAAAALAELDRWQLDAPDSVQALLWKAYALDRLERREDAARLLELARERPRLKTDPELQATLGYVLEARSEIGPAKRAYREASRLARSLGDRPLEASALARLVALHRKLGEDVEAAEAAGLARSLPPPSDAP